MGQLKNMHKRCVAKFRSELLSGLKGEGHDFGALVQEIGSRVEKEFVAGAQGKCRSSTPDHSKANLLHITEIQLKDTDWQFEDELKLLRDDIKLIADQCRADETKKMVNAIEVCY